MAFRREQQAATSFSQLTIGLSSPEEILQQSYGEVLKPETINYRTYKAERDGLFCERIFGPVKDYECHCGKYKRIRYKGIVCDRCGVEVTEKKVRRQRVGHISLVVPVAHIWFFRSLPNKMANLLGIGSKKLDSIVYYERYFVIQPGIAAEKNVQVKDLLSEAEYWNILDDLPPENQQLDDEDPNKFIALMGAEALLKYFEKLDLDELSYSLRDQIEHETSQQRKAEALKSLNVVESFRAARGVSKPEWMLLKVIPVIPPDLRPLVPLDGGRFATADLNDLYRRIIIRNNRLKRLLEIKAPSVILRNEKRMLQESVDSLFDNSHKSSAVKTENNRPLKSLSDSLKGKQGRFRQNLLGKRVDYSARSVIVVGPDLKMHECGIPKEMAAELYKPFIIRKLIERGIVKTVKTAKKIIDRRDAVIWDVLENLLKGHPVLLNRAPTLHRLSIQAFQPKLIEGKAIQLHPLVCTGFNADFDGDQMAVHLPLSNAAILEAQLLMLASHNILNPANGTPITVPSQDMVLGLYYLTKEAKGRKGEGMTFYSPEEVLVAHNEEKVDTHAIITVRIEAIDNEGNSQVSRINTTPGRILFNQYVPKQMSYVNQLLTKKTLRDIIEEMFKTCGNKVTAEFLDNIKSLGYETAFTGGLSFNLFDVIVPKEKVDLVARGDKDVLQIMENYNMGVITNSERYKQTIDVWTDVNDQLTKEVLDRLSTDKEGFNSVYMMLDSGARGSKEQIRQLCGMRGLMAKPQKTGGQQAQIIENPILSNFREGLSVLEYFISTHGARKGLADTALKTADAGYLTRRLVDVAQDVVVKENDCGTLRGITISAVKRNDEEIISLYERILGRTPVDDVYDPETNQLIVGAGEEITQSIAKRINDSSIEQVEIRSALTCETKRGVCVKCYGQNMATGRLAQLGDAVGVVAAQSVGEPGTQLTLRTFHVGGIARNISTQSNMVVNQEGILRLTEIRTVTYKDKSSTYEVVSGRIGDASIIDPKTGAQLFSQPIPYGAKLYFKDGASVKKGDIICEWDPYNAVIVSEYSGKVSFEDLDIGITYLEETDEQTGFKERVIVESRDKKKVPSLHVSDAEGMVIKTYNLPVQAHINVEEGEVISAGCVLVKIPRMAGKTSDITGGLPRVTELFEARNPSSPAVVAEIEGEVEYGRIKRGQRDIHIKPRVGEMKTYAVPLHRQILVQEGDYVRAGTSLSDGAVCPADILSVQGPTAVQEYIVNEVQDVYRLQGVQINDKHFEVIVRQMMSKVEIEDAGDTLFTEQQLVDKVDFMQMNDNLYGKRVIVNAGDSEAFKAGQMVSMRELKEENAMLKRKEGKLVESREAVPATSKQVLQGITRASLQTKSWLSAASFQETTKVLNNAAISGKVDLMEGLKENVICGQLIPAGTGQRRFFDIDVEKIETEEKA